MTLGTCVGLVAAGVVCAAAQAAVAEQPVNIASRLEPFVDDYLIEKIRGAELTLHHPVPREVALVHDQPWEGNTCAYHTVFRDGERVRMYYRGSHHDPKTRKASPQVVCYAESKDGIRWTRPQLNLVEINGSRKNNVIWSGVGSHNFAPFKDANPDCKDDEKYKALGTGKGGLVAFRSPDGIHWSLIRPEPVVTQGAFDSQNLAFWDTVRGRYVEFHRGFRKGVRDIMTSTSKDFRTWTDPVWLSYPGSPTEHLYTNQIAPYSRAPHLFLGFPKRFMPSRRATKHRAGGVSDGLFMTSRDGLNFKRWGEAFVRPGPQKERWVCRNNMTAWGIVETRPDIAGVPNELSIYSTESYYQGPSCRIRRFTIRIDGFVSVQAPLRGGEVLTKPLTFAGKELAINFSTSGAGSVRAEIQDADGKPLDGFAVGDCPEIYGDAIEHVVRWRGGADLSALAGRAVRLRFVLKDADLYALRFR